MANADRMFKFPAGKDVKIRFLDHEIRPSMFWVSDDPAKRNIGNAATCLHHSSSPSREIMEETTQLIDSIRHSSALSSLPDFVSFGGWTLPTKTIQHVRAIQKLKSRIPVPKRKKKSWMSYCTKKKWARSFPIRYVHENRPVVLQLSDKVAREIEALSSRKSGT